ncbi:MAG: efflux transporter periplasmic adaptor subunit, partial [Burkholderiales bacterium]|nr:efflux transporter periplasmic adaptor subunit [Burkholderiales bacterium]
ALLVPEEAVIAIGGEQRVYRVHGDKVEMVSVETGLRRAGMVEITHGLQPGDLIVTAGHLRLKPGATVAYTEPSATVAVPNKAATPAAPPARPSKNAS